MGYHTRQIAKGEIGKISKIREELEELEDANLQNIQIMELIELSDMYGAIEEYAATFGATMEDLKAMSNATKNAFKDGTRK